MHNVHVTCTMYALRKCVSLKYIRQKLRSVYIKCMGIGKKYIWLLILRAKGGNLIRTWSEYYRGLHFLEYIHQFWDQQTFGCTSSYTCTVLAFGFSIKPHHWVSSQGLYTSDVAQNYIKGRLLIKHFRIKTLIRHLVALQYRVLQYIVYLLHSPN